ncbi:flagellar filament capping protein FliD [Gallaecimonas kandeliae]|uniref:flagellar filament capping protein FliD n=1 Tax=Gallaecimonas kandeliae TaxID=3029055 RepID=UPI002647895C|nr:flagellar filament capping protein FliD [Gallaecimonas kandeliae]WKE66541.1 flagellar filament capping protein FliD [Gallaecimonas kandeliae]
MATIDNSFDVRSLASQYVAADRAPMDQYFSTQQTYYQSRLKAFNAISSQISSFQDVLAKLKTSDSFEAFGVTASDDSHVSVTASTSATPGQYQFHVQQLAAADQYALDFASDTDPAPTSGILTLGVGSNSFSIDMSTLPAGATISDLRDAINNAADNSGVKATLVRTGGAVKFLLTAEQTGAANTLSISTNGDPAMASLDSAIAAKTQLSTAQDAIVQMGANQSLTINSASNTLNNVIDGLTINLTQVHANATDTTTITVGRDTDATKKQLQDFVDGYNALIDQLKKYSTADGDQIPVLAGDGTARMLQSQMRGLFNGLNLGQMGLKTDQYGKFSLDDSKLDDYLAANPDGLNQVLGGTNGMMAQLNTVLDRYVKDDTSVLKASAKSAQANLDRLSDRMDQFDQRMEGLYNRYVSQFTQMQTLVSQMQQTSSLF